jgi:hypothetical protein
MKKVKTLSCSHRVHAAYNTMFSCQNIATASALYTDLMRSLKISLNRSKHVTALNRFKVFQLLQFRVYCDGEYKILYSTSIHLRVRVSRISVSLLSCVPLMALTERETLLIILLEKTRRYWVVITAVKSSAPDVITSHICNRPCVAPHRSMTVAFPWMDRDIVPKRLGGFSGRRRAASHWSVLSFL